MEMGRGAKGRERKGRGEERREINSCNIFNELRREWEGMGKKEGEERKEREERS